eukprot:765978-Hanusia_phi.AAC.5
MQFELICCSSSSQISLSLSSPPPSSSPPFPSPYPSIAALSSSLQRTQESCPHPSVAPAEEIPARCYQTSEETLT